jgi:hypothetical protein
MRSSGHRRELGIRSTVVCWSGGAPRRRPCRRSRDRRRIRTRSARRSTVGLPEQAGALRGDRGREGQDQCEAEQSSESWGFRTSKCGVNCCPKIPRPRAAGESSGSRIQLGQHPRQCDREGHGDRQLLRIPPPRFPKNERTCIKRGVSRGSGAPRERGTVSITPSLDRKWRTASASSLAYGTGLAVVSMRRRAPPGRHADAGPWRTPGGTSATTPGAASWDDSRWRSPAARARDRRRSGRLFSATDGGTGRTECGTESVWPSPTSSTVRPIVDLPQHLRPVFPLRDAVTPRRPLISSRRSSGRRPVRDEVGECS